MNPKISIIVVNYKVENELINCIDSIYSSNPNIKFEIIIVDNNSNSKLKGLLKSKFPKVMYIKSPNNIGFGAGNNLGVKYAKGEYLFIINPDTRIFPGTIEKLYNFLKNNQYVGIAAPLLIDKKGRTFIRQGSKKLTLLNAILSLSFLCKIFAGKVKSFYFENWNKKTNQEVDVAPGTAFMVSKELFKKINGFDERFFLYFEENDICNRVKNLGYKIFILSDSKIFHKIGASTKKYYNSEKEFKKSRFLYFKKYYGFPVGLLIEAFLRINKYLLFVFSILIFALFLRIYNLSQSMSFIGDQGWFYLSARNILLTGNIPLVGITSSHIWLHQGPLWTYMLAVMLFIFKFNPISGAYLTASLGILGIFLIYKFVSEMFSNWIGIIASIIYASSPLVLISDRMPFHPAPIPLFEIIYFYAFYKWIKGNVNFFPLMLFSLAILYNFELATFILFFPTILMLAYGFFKGKIWVKQLFNKRIVIFSLISIMVPMIPIIIYDFSNKFHQTIVFPLWTVYKSFSILTGNMTGSVSFLTMLQYFASSIQKLIFGPNMLISVILFISSLIYLFYFILKNKKGVETSEFLLLYLLIFSVIGILISGTPSGAYLPIIFPFVIVLISFLLCSAMEYSKIKYLTILFLLVLLFGNLYSDKNVIYGHDFNDRLKAVNKILVLTKNSQYNLIGRGSNSNFASFTMNYEYLLWWKGHPPSQNMVSTKVFIEETNHGILITKH